MIKSMTGFGRSIYENEGREYLVEIKSVNNRFSDINIKMLRSLNYSEETLTPTVRLFLTARVVTLKLSNPTV